MMQIIKRIGLILLLKRIMGKDSFKTIKETKVSYPNNSNVEEALLLMK